MVLCPVCRPGDGVAYGGAVRESERCGHCAVSAAEKGVCTPVIASHYGMPFIMKEDCKKINTDNTLGPTRDATRHATLKGKVTARNAGYL